MLSKQWIPATASLVAGALVVIGLAGPGRAEPKPRPVERVELPDKDARAGRLPPTKGQQDAARGATVRWNDLGTPATVTDTEPLAKGLPADPERTARAYLADHQDLFGLDAAAVAALEKVAVNPIGEGAAVLLRQRFGDLPSGYDGLATIGVVDGKVMSVTSTLSRRTGAPEPATLDADAALSAAAADAGINVSKNGTRRTKLVAVPTSEGVRSAYQVVLVEGADGAEPQAVTSYVDARTGKVLIRRNLVKHDSDNPRWAAFPSSPPGNYSSTDTRQTWCFAPASGCGLVVGRDASTGLPWDVDPTSGTSTLTSSGNAARTFDGRNIFRESVGTHTNAAKADRNYLYPWTNQWHTSKCDPAALGSSQAADLQASIANLFAQHNRMHDWSYRLGFTETAWNMQVSNGDRGGLGGDPQLGNAQSSAGFMGLRNNANQIPTPDGMSPVSNMYLYQPIAGSSYPQCVDSAFDMSIIAHEYTHAISDRMIAGPDNGWPTEGQGGALNESTSDLFAMEYLNEYGLPSSGLTPYVTAAYTTGDKRTGIRNYDMSKSPLNYSNLGYDIVGTQNHSDGEIWTATQFDVRQAFINRYGAADATLQRRCADGQVPVAQCPGNRRWAQLSLDALLLMASGDVSYLEYRDALLAADAIRFGGANHEMMWKVFAEHGLGQGADSNGDLDPDPVPSFASPMSRNANITIQPTGEAAGANVRLYVGDYEARSVPVADTNPGTPEGVTFAITPGTYTFTAVGFGFGHKKFTATVNEDRTLQINMTRNLAAATNGASATGDGESVPTLLDETEHTGWRSLTGPVAGRQVTVDLAGDQPVAVGRVQVSAMLYDEDSPNPFTALRAFELLACDATKANCAQDGSYRPVYTSPGNAFPADRLRPIAPELTLRSFDLADTTATHLRLRVTSSQCTGTPEYAGEQDNDPGSNTDCGTASPWAEIVRAAELQVYSS